MNDHSHHNKSLQLNRSNRIVLLSVAVAIFSLLIRQFNDADTWWHLAIGRNILETMSVPRFDQFTAAGWGRPYHDSHWLFQVVLAVVDGFGGAVAVGLVPAVCWSVTLGYSFRSICNWLPPAIGSLLLFVLALACNSRFIPRPDIITCLMIALYYQRIQSDQYRTYPQLFFLGVMQIVWSNAHGLFIIGPFMVFCYVADALWKSIADKHLSELLIPAVRLLSVSLVASLCTPFGVEGWSYALKIALEAGPSAHQIYLELSELQPVFSLKMASNADGWAFYFIVTATFGLAIDAMYRKKISFSRLAIVLGLLAAACSGRRNIPLYALVAVPFIAELISKRFGRIEINWNQKLRAILFLLCFSILPISGFYYKYFNYDPIRFGLGAPPELQPSGLPAFLRKTGFEGQIYNNDLFGGFLLYNRILPLFDGRWEIYDLNELTALLNAPFDPVSWQWIEDRYRIKGVLLRHGEPGTKAFVVRFMSDGSYQPVYDDGVSSFWVKNTR